MVHCDFSFWESAISVPEYGTPIKSELTSVGGRPAMKIGFKEAVDGTVWIAADSPHVILRWTSKPTAGDVLTILFSNFNKPFTVKMPDPSKILSGTQRA